MAKLAGWQWARDTFAGLVHGHRHSADGPDPIRPADIGAVVDGDVAGTLRSVSGGSDTAFGGNTGVTIGQALQALSQDIGEGIAAGGSDALIQASGSVTLPETDPVGSLLGFRVTDSATFTHSTGNATLAAGAYVFENLGSTWIYRAIDAGTVLVPDTAAPGAGTLAESSVIDTSFTLTVTGASDDTALHATPYAFSTDNGSTWSAWQAGATYTVSGRSPSTAYTCRHKVRDAAGNEATGTAITVTTAAPPPNPPPIAGSLSSSNVTDTSFTLTVTGASDDEALHALPYAFSLDGGTTWTGWQGGAVYSVAGAPATTYSCRHKVRDAEGSETLGAAIDVTTLAEPAGLPLTDTFTAADDTLVIGRTVSGFTWAADSGNNLNLGSGGPVIRQNTAVDATNTSGAVLDVGVTNVRLTAKLSCDSGFMSTVDSHRLMIGGARINPTDPHDSLYAILRADGSRVTMYGPGPTQIGTVGTFPGMVGVTGTATLEYDGTTASLKWNGDTIISGPVTLTGTQVGFIVRNIEAPARVDDFHVEEF